MKMGTTLKDNLQSTSVAVLMINAQGMLITVQGQDYFLSYNLSLGYVMLESAVF
mgnify:CR=1 FL=1